MKRVTISLPDDLEADVRAAVELGAAKNVSRFLAEAARRHLDALVAEDLRRAVAALDPDEEVSLARRRTRPRGGGPWKRLA